MDIIHPTCSKDQYSIIFEDYIDIQWVGLRENLNRKPCFSHKLYFMDVSGKDFP